MQHGTIDNQTKDQRAEGQNAPSKSASQGQHGGIDPSMIALRSSWPGVVADLSFRYGDFFTLFEPMEHAPKVELGNNWLQMVVKGDNGCLNFYLPAKLCTLFLFLADDNVDVNRLKSEDVAIIMEHVFTDNIVKLEQVLGSKLMVEKVVDVSVPVSEETYGFSVIVDEVTYECAFSVTGALQHEIRGLIGHNTNLQDKNVSKKLIVHLGPVVIPATQAYLARTGETIDCGVTPMDIIKGIMMRSDGRYWPVFIEDDMVEIAGDLSEPVQIPTEKSDDVFVTFGIGEVNLTAYERAQMEPGSRAYMTRLENNSANIYYQTRPFGQGNISLLENNLAVTLQRIGMFNE